MKGHKNQKVSIFLVVVSAVLLSVGCGINTSDSWKSKIPYEIKLGKTLAITDDWLGSPGGGCGGAIFQLEELTALEIKNTGISFFEGISKSYITWTSGATDGQSDLSFQCVIKSSAERRFYQDKLREAYVSKNYYFGALSGGSKTKILIYPDEGLVYIGYWD